MSIYVTSPVDNNHVDESTNDYSNEKDNSRVEDNRDKEDQQQSNKQGIKRKYIRILLLFVYWGRFYSFTYKNNSYILSYYEQLSVGIRNK